MGQLDNQPIKKLSYLSRDEYTNRSYSREARGEVTFASQAVIAKVMSTMSGLNSSLAEEEVAKIVDRAGDGTPTPHYDASLYQSIVQEAVQNWVAADEIKVTGMLASLLLNQQQMREDLEQDEEGEGGGTSVARFTTAWSKNLVLRVLLPLHLRHPTEKGHGT
ncbi:hypothetical protein AK812_SmicGene25145 [Symbiodinium microadriaticum]|uniref:Uncharacterized protein n=1 Tax=Symbiodinium microadriaticum TaxID=2951 RepID=A0A1Q9DCS9_SYMMI|nr:hypothetical protein AK812_SmicGene25145 [Symbiodinium microadriaticum]